MVKESSKPALIALLHFGMSIENTVRLFSNTLCRLRVSKYQTIESEWAILTYGEQKHNFYTQIKFTKSKDQHFNHLPRLVNHNYCL